MTSKHDATDFGADVLDSRGLDDRLIYLEECGTVCEDEEREAEEDIETREYVCEDFDCPIHNEDMKKELESLIEMRDESGDEWRYGISFIAESYFKDYARDYAEDIHGNALSDAQWPFDSIDWDDAADSLQMDYTMITVDGSDFWYR